MSSNATNVDVKLKEFWDRKDNEIKDVEVKKVIDEYWTFKGCTGTAKLYDVVFKFDS